MFATFESVYAPDPPTRNRVLDGLKGSKYEPLMGPFFNTYAGASFCGGIYRVCDGVTQALAQTLADMAWQPGRYVAFACDWIGTVFAIDGARQADGSAAVSLLMPGTGKALNTKASLTTFHERELVEFPEDCVALSSYERWTAGGGARPGLDQCVGYKRPLFLNGTDDNSNCELSSLTVYWDLMGQLIAKTRNLPSGTKIGSIKLK